MANNDRTEHPVTTEDAVENRAIDVPTGDVAKPETELSESDLPPSSEGVRSSTTSVPAFGTAQAGSSPDADAADIVEPAPTEPEPAEPVLAAKPKEPRRLGLIGAITAALLSGVLGGAIAFALVGTFYSADENIDALTELEARALDLRQRVEALEARGDASAPASNIALPAELAARVDALEAGLHSLGQKIDNEPPPAAAADTSALSSKLAALEQRVAALPPPSPGASPEAVAALGTRLAGLEKQLTQASNDEKAGQHRTAQLIALGALQDAIVAGLPFTTELTASRALLGGAGDVLSPLQTAATQGYPDGLTLAVRLAAAGEAARKAEQVAEVPKGVLERLTDSASKLVTIRRADEPVADQNSDKALLATAVGALQRSDFAAAGRAIDAMTAAARAPLAPVAEIIDARQAALNTIGMLRQGILTSLSGGAQ